MNYITAKQFLEQSKEVKQIFLDWWKPQFGDLFINKFDYNCNLECVQKFIGNSLNRENNKKEKCIPLLQIHQLIHFIEDKANEKFKLNYDTKHGYTICFYNKDDIWTWKQNLLQALWYAAFQIANEHIGKDNIKEEKPKTKFKLERYEFKDKGIYW